MPRSYSLFLIAALFGGGWYFTTGPGAGKLGFKDEAVAHESVEHIDHLYRQFELAGDRAGQHHALVMALTMFDRARWTNKQREADVFRNWLSDRLNESEPSLPPKG